MGPGDEKDSFLQVTLRKLINEEELRGEKILTPLLTNLLVNPSFILSSGL